MHHLHVSNITGSLAAILPMRMRHGPALCSTFLLARPQCMLPGASNTKWLRSYPCGASQASCAMHMQCPTLCASFSMQAVRGHAAGGLDAAQRADGPDAA